jgi:hypothetical protein
MENLNVDGTPAAVPPTPEISAAACAAPSAEPVAPPKPLTAEVGATPSTPPIKAAIPAPSNRFVVLAGAVAVAAAFGSLAGALAATGFAKSTASPIAATAGKPQDLRVLEATIEQIRTELAALRTGVEAGTRNSNTQISKITERFDRVERAQTERSAKLAKAPESPERLDRRTEAAPAKDITGSIPLPTPAPAQAPASAPATTVAHAAAASPQPSSLPGWSLRDVYRGVALIQSPRNGMLEVEAGDTVPYLGRIESIRRQEGRWVVVTSKGIITAQR